MLLKSLDPLMLRECLLRALPTLQNNLSLLLLPLLQQAACRSRALSSLQKSLGYVLLLRDFLPRAPPALQSNPSAPLPYKSCLSGVVLMLQASCKTHLQVWFASTSMLQRHCSTDYSRRWVPSTVAMSLALCMLDDVRQNACVGENI